MYHRLPVEKQFTKCCTSALSYLILINSDLHDESTTLCILNKRTITRCLQGISNVTIALQNCNSLNNPRKWMTLHQGLSFIFLVYEFIYKHSKLPFMKYTKESVSELSHAMGV